MFDWIENLVSGIGESISTAFTDVWNKISGSIWDKFFEWIYKTFYSAIAELFTTMGNMGTELFDLPWVKAVITFFQYFGWALFVTGLVVAVFDTAIEYQSMQRINIKRQVLPFLWGFLAVNLFTVVPVKLYTFSITIQGILMKDLSSLFASGESAGSNLGIVATAALNTISPSLTST